MAIDRDNLPRTADGRESLWAQLAAADPLGLVEGVFNHSRVPYAVFAVDGHCVFTNLAFCRMFGREPPPDYSILKDEIAERRGMAGLVRRAFAGETVTTPTVWYDPKELEHVDGSEANRVAISCTFFPLHSAEGGITHVAIAYRDVTGELLAKESAERERDLLRALIEQSGDGIIVADAKGVVRIFNPAAEHQHGTSRQEVSAAQWAETYGLLDMEGRPLRPTQTPLFRALHGETVTNARWQVKRPDREIRTLEGTATPLRTSEGAPAGAVLLARDVTERRCLEEALKSSEEQFRTLAESIPQLAWTSDRNGSIYWFNERWYEYTGTTFDEVKGWGWKSVQDPADLDRVMANFTAALESGTPWEDELRLRRVDGSFRWFLSRARPVRDANGDIGRWVGTHTDTDEQRRLSGELREAVRVRDEFLSVASHELKTPLTPLSLRLQALDRQVGEASDSPIVSVARRYVETAQRQIKKLNELVGALLDVTRIEAGRFHLEPELVDFSQLIHEVVARYLPEAQRLGSKVEVHADGGMVSVWDRMRLEQVVTNLVDNALKYGVGKPVVLRLKKEKGRAVLTVQDHGIGIEPQNLARIFERFERAVPGRHYGGLGLGLYITRQVVEAHGGTLSVASTPGKGSTFRVELPLQQAPGSAPQRVPA